MLCNISGCVLNDHGAREGDCSAGFVAAGDGVAAVGMGMPLAAKIFSPS